MFSTLYNILNVVIGILVLVITAMMGMLMASLPMLIFYLFGQRYFIQGLVAGAIKG